MSSNNEKTFATRFLDDYPAIRNKVLDSEKFMHWKEQFPTLVVDETKFYLMGGNVSMDQEKRSDEVSSLEIMNPGADQLQEEDEIILLWARLNGIVTKEEIDDSHEK